MKIIHIGSAGSIMISFVKFVNKNFVSADHLFMLAPENGHEMPNFDNVFDLGVYPVKLRFGPKVWIQAYRAEKIILHGIFDPRLVFLLTLQPWLLKKCYWFIWGGDLYDHQLGKKTWRWKMKEFLKKRIIPRLGHFVTHVKGDYELAQKWYGAKGVWHECFMYPSNLYKDYAITYRSHDGINILLGNSASQSNNHLDALERLRPYACEKIRIYCPLSYGDANYGDGIAEAGKAIFGGNFIPLREYMPFDKYLELLADIDIAVFNHNRQQGMGNITTLLGMGKMVYVRSDTTSWQTLTGMGLVLGDTRSLELRQLPSEISAANRDIITSRFSESVLMDQFRAIIEN